MDSENLPAPHATAVHLAIINPTYATDVPRQVVNMSRSLQHEASSLTFPAVAHMQRPRLLRRIIS